MEAWHTPAHAYSRHANAIVKIPTQNIPQKQLTRNIKQLLYCRHRLSLIVWGI